MNSTSLSKLMSLALRHQPEVLALELDRQGWIAVDTLVAAIQQKHPEVSLQQVLRVVQECPKQRFAIDNKSQRIRANQGHSIEVELELEAQVPPPVLYHGTATRFLDKIHEHGLLAGNRQYVHLTDKIDTALNVGERHGVPCLLEIRALEMHQDGHHFFLSANKVWMTECVPTRYIKRA